MKLSLQLILETLTEYGAQLIETVCLHTESAPKAEKAAF